MQSHGENTQEAIRNHHADKIQMRSRSNTVADLETKPETSK